MVLRDRPTILPGLLPIADTLCAARMRRCFDTGRRGPYYARAMVNLLRERRTVAEWASAGQVIVFAEKVGSFEHFAGIVETDLAALDPDKLSSGWRDGTVLGKLQFGFANGDGRVPIVTGYATAGVDAVCQRCLEPFRLQLSVELQLLLLDEQDAADEFEDFEVWELGEETLQPLDIIEELLIMALPFSATHDDMADCKAFSTAESVEKISRPFAALRSQMQQNKLGSDE